MEKIKEILKVIGDNFFGIIFILMVGWCGFGALLTIILNDRNMVKEIIRKGDAPLFIMVFLVLISIITALAYIIWDAGKSDRLYKKRMAKNRKAISNLVNKL